MKKNLPGPAAIAILTTITVFIWIFFDIYRVLKKTPIVNVDPKILEPINPSLDQNILDKIGDRIYFDESTLNSRINTSVPEPEAEPQPTEIPASGSAEQIQ